MIAERLFQCGPTYRPFTFARMFDLKAEEKKGQNRSRGENTTGWNMHSPRVKLAHQIFSSVTSGWRILSP
jgi:hypothetical protein